MEENYKDSKQYKEFQKKLKENKCKECGGTNHMLIHHKDTCSQFKHLVDDHYDSSCMRGTCKYCNPDYKPKIIQQLTEEEYEVIKKMREK